MAAMAAWLPDVQHGRAESCKLLKYKLEEPHYSTNTWYFSRKEIEERSPSRKDGICLRKETYLRTLYCGFLQDLGKALKVPQTIATACIFLAGKAEDTPVWLKDLSVVSHGIIHKTDTGAAERIKQWEYYMKQKELILLGERILLSTIGFDFNIMHPYKPLVAALKRLKLEQSELTKVAWNIVNDCLQTTLCLQFKPHYIAACAMYLAAKLLNVKLPSGGGKVWWQEFDVAPFQLDEIIKQMFELLVPKRREPLPHTKTSSRLVPKINKQGGREDFSKSSEGTLQQLQNPVHVKVSSERMESEIRPCKGVQKRRASPIPHTVASPRRVSDFTTQDGREGFSSSSDESLDNLQHPVCVEVNDESMHSEIIPCNGRLSELQPYESMLLETGTGCAKFYEYNSRERQDVNECRFTEDGQMWTRVEISGVEEGNSTEENVNQSQHPFCVEINAGSLQSEIRHCQGKLSEALATSSSTMKTSVDVSLQNQDVNQYKVIEGNQMWVAVEISGVTTNSSSEASLNQVQLPVCIEVNAETMQSEIRISTGMQSGVGHRESVLLENSSGYMKSSENGSQQKQDVDKYRFTEGEMRIAVEISGVKKGIMRSSLNVISDVDKERIRESLKRRRKERATKQITAVASVEDSYDSWIEKELEDGIELTVQPPKWKARHDDEEDSYDSWIEKELEDGIELNSSSTKLENRDMMTKKTLMTPGLRKSWKMVVSLWFQPRSKT